MDTLTAIKSLSASQVGSQPKSGKSKLGDQPATAFGLVLQGTVNKGKHTPVDSADKLFLGVNVKALKQQLTQAITSLSEQKPPLTDNNAQLKGLLEQLLKKLDGKDGKNSTTPDQLAPLLKDLDTALEKKQAEIDDVQQETPWNQLLVTVQNMGLQNQQWLQKNPGEAVLPEGDELKAGATPQPIQSTQPTTAQITAPSSGMKTTDLSSQNPQPVVQQNKGQDQLVNALSLKEGKATTDLGGPTKTPKVTKVTSLVQLLPEKQKSDESAGKSNLDLSTMLTGGRPMNKVQQLLFHQLNAPEQSPADQIANQIKVWMSQGALKSSNGQLSINLNLHPDNLGSVQLAITQTDGGLTASITAHSGLTKDLIESQLNHLQQALSASGIAVYKLDVNLAQPSSGTPDQSYQPPQDQGQGKNQGQHQSTQQDQTTEGPEFETWLKEGMDT
jgi:flagellar hook-length control protein FliK